MGIPPQHYATDNGIQPFDVIDAYDLGYYGGSAMKYLLRAHRKGEFTSDLGKARHFLQEYLLRLPESSDEWQWEAIDPSSVPAHLYPANLIRGFGIDNEFVAAAVFALCQGSVSNDPGWYFRSAIAELNDILLCMMRQRETVLLDVSSTSP